MINQNSTLYSSYLDVLINRCFKIIPLFEESNQWLPQYIGSLIYELKGLENVIEGLEDSARFVSLLATLESIYDEALFDDNSYESIRREVFKCIDIIKKLKLKRCDINESI